MSDVSSIRYSLDGWRNVSVLRAKSSIEHERVAYIPSDLGAISVRYLGSYNLNILHYIVYYYVKNLALIDFRIELAIFSI